MVCWQSLYWVSPLNNDDRDHGKIVSPVKKVFLALHKSLLFLIVLEILVKNSLVSGMDAKGPVFGL